MISAVVGIVGMIVTGTSRSSYEYEMSNYKKGKQANITNICRSLHGGLSRDGREDEAYPLQPYYFLALIPWQYDHLDEEYA